MFPDTVTPSREQKPPADTHMPPPSLSDQPPVMAPVPFESLTVRSPPLYTDTTGPTG